jgi:hypothetical protein
MPSYNQASFIEAAARSVLEQRLPLPEAADPQPSGAGHADGLGFAPVELVVVDGGSTDGSLAVLAALEDEFGSRLRWISEPDQGPANAINKAAKLARGEMLGWLNSDDLYAPGAVQRALQHFAAHPDHVMVYGEAEHIDVEGNLIERYPSLRPEGGIERFRDGCFICQPSIFIRRDIWAKLGGLDESYRASFDFELWLRVFQRFRGRIGFIDVLQARSRLHAGSITLRFRERVAREGVRLLSEHLGHAPARWLLTCFEDTLAAHPGADPALDPSAHLRQLAEELAPRIDPAERPMLLQRLAEDRRVALARPGLAVRVFPDGWAPATLRVDCVIPGSDANHVLLQGRHASPLGGALSLRIWRGDALIGEACVRGNGPFELRLPLDAHGTDPVSFRIEALQTFVPASTASYSLRAKLIAVAERLGLVDSPAPASDDRELAFLVEAAQIV